MHRLKELAVILAMAATAVPALGADRAPSVIMIPVTVDMEQISAALEKLVPTESSGSQPVSLPDPGRDGKVEWNLRRGPITASGDGGALAAHTEISGSASVKGNIRIIAKIPFSSTADLAGEATLSAAPTLQPDWTIEPHLAGSARLTRAEVDIARLGTLSLRGALQPSLDDKVGRLVAQAAEKLAADQALKVAAQKAWSDLCGAHRIRGSDGMPELYLMVEPVAVGAGPIEISPDGIRLVVSLTAFTRLSDVAETMACGPLPDLTPPAAGGLHLDVTAKADYGTLSQALTRGIAGQSLKSPDGNFEVKVREVRLAPDGERLAVSADLGVRSTQLAMLGFDGTVGLTARPVLDAEAQKVRLQDVELSTGADAGLPAGVGGVLGPLLAGMLGAEAGIDIAAPLDRARTQLEAAAARLREDAVPGLRIRQADVKDIKLTELSVASDGLALRIVADGALALEAIPVELLK